MFKVVTNSGHWRALYVSPNATADFVGISVEEAVTSSTVSLVTVAKREESDEGGTDRRGAYIFVLADSGQLALAIAASLRAECGSALSAVVDGGSDRSSLSEERIRSACENIDRQLKKENGSRIASKWNTLLSIGAMAASICALGLAATVQQGPIGPSGADGKDGSNPRAADVAAELARSEQHLTALFAKLSTSVTAKAELEKAILDRLKKAEDVADPLNRQISLLALSTFVATSSNETSFQALDVNTDGYLSSNDNAFLLASVSPDATRSYMFFWLFVCVETENGTAPSRFKLLDNAGSAQDIALTKGVHSVQYCGRALLQTDNTTFPLRILSTTKGQRSRVKNITATIMSFVKKQL